MHHFHNYIFKKKYYSDTYSFSRIVNDTCFAVAQHCNRMAALCIWGYWHVIIPQSQYLNRPPIALTLSVSACWILFYSSCAYKNCWWITVWCSIYLIRLSRLSNSCSMDDNFASHNRSWSRATWRVLAIFLFVICNFFCGQITCCGTAVQSMTVFSQKWSINAIQDNTRLMTALHSLNPVNREERAKCQIMQQEMS